MTGRRRSAIVAMAFGYASILVSLARNILFVPIYLRSIPLAEYGAWLATGGALALILVNDFGLSGVVTQKISSSYGAGDAAAIGRLTGSALAIGGILAVLLTAISLAVVPVLPGLHTLSAPQSRAVVNCFLIAIGANALGLIGATTTSVIRSLQKATAAGSIVLVADVANVIVTLLGLIRGHGLYAIAAGMLARSAAITAGGAVGLAMIRSSAVQMTLEIRWQAVRELFADASRFFLTSMAMKLLSQANVVLVSAIISPASAAIYSLTVRAHETVMMLISQINVALVPSVTHLVGSGNLARFRAVLLRLLLTMAAVTGLALSTTVILNAGFLHLWLADQSFPESQQISVLMGMALFTSSLGYVAYDALVAQGRFTAVSKVFFLSSVFHLLLLASLLQLGLWFAPTATLITALVWGSLFWRSVAGGIGMTVAEARRLFAELARIFVFSAATCAVFLSLHPVANSWLGLVSEGLLALATLGCGYLILSTTIRTAAREEIGMTLRALRSAR
jgi:O-antigen/teichoic acid export membrane protein